MSNKTSGLNYCSIALLKKLTYVLVLAGACLFLMYRSRVKYCNGASLKTCPSCLRPWKFYYPLKKNHRHRTRPPNFRDQCSKKLLQGSHKKGRSVSQMSTIGRSWLRCIQVCEIVSFVFLCSIESRLRVIHPSNIWPFHWYPFRSPHLSQSSVQGHPASSRAWEWKIGTATGMEVTTRAKAKMI